MPLFRRPDAEDVEAFRRAREQTDLSYRFVGRTATDAPPPAHYTGDRAEYRLGRGRECYRRAVQGLLEWRVFDLDWTEAHRPATSTNPGDTVVIVIRVGPSWWLCPSRVVYTEGLSDRPDTPPASAAWAYGTLPGHVEHGEERFEVEWRADDSVWYKIEAFSRPARPIVSWGYPVARLLQARFRHDSGARMRAYVGHGAYEHHEDVHHEDARTKDQPAEWPDRQW